MTALTSARRRQTRTNVKLHESARAVDGGRWTVDGGRWTVDGGRWTVDGGRWTVDGGRWTVDGGRWTVRAEKAVAAGFTPVVTPQTTQITLSDRNGRRRWNARGVIFASRAGVCRTRGIAIDSRIRIYRVLGTEDNPGAEISQKRGIKTTTSGSTAAVFAVT